MQIHISVGVTELAVAHASLKFRRGSLGWRSYLEVINMKKSNEITKRLDLDREEMGSWNIPHI